LKSFTTFWASLFFFPVFFHSRDSSVPSSHNQDPRRFLPHRCPPTALPSRHSFSRFISLRFLGQMWDTNRFSLNTPNSGLQVFMDICTVLIDATKVRFPLKLIWLTPHMLSSLLSPLRRLARRPSVGTLSRFFVPSLCPSFPPTFFRPLPSWMLDGLPPFSLSPVFSPSDGRLAPGSTEFPCKLLKVLLFRS